MFLDIFCQPRIFWIIYSERGATVWIYSFLGINSESKRASSQKRLCGSFWYSGWISSSYIIGIHWQITWEILLLMGVCQIYPRIFTPVYNCLKYFSQDKIFSKNGDWRECSSLKENPVQVPWGGAKRILN